MAYFDEIAEADCGSCDVCRRNQSSKKRESAAKFLREIRELLFEPTAVETLKEKCRDESESRILRWALDKDLIRIKDSRATWTGPKLVMDNEERLV